MTKSILDKLDEAEKAAHESVERFELPRNNIRALIDIARAAEKFHTAWAKGEDLFSHRHFLGEALAKLEGKK